MGVLTKEQIKFLDDHKHLYEMVVKAGYCRNFTKDIYNQLSEIHLQHIGIHNFNHWCSECRLLLVKQVFSWYEKEFEHYNNAMEVFASITNDYEVASKENDDNKEINVDQPVKKKRGRKPKTSS